MEVATPGYGVPFWPSTTAPHRRICTMLQASAPLSLYVRLSRFTLHGIALFICLTASQASAVTGWFDNACRRPIDVIWDAEHANAGDLCAVEFLTGGHVNADGSDLRIATDEGRQVPARVLRVGPGDRISAVFSLVKNVRRYHAYFGNPRPPADKAAMKDLKIESGLLLETHTWVGGPVQNMADVEAAWAKSGPVIGQTMIDTAFYGINPFGSEGPAISRLTGSLFAPIDGDYAFSIFVEDRGSLYLDGKPVLFATRGPADVSQQAKVHLTRGRHDFLFYHVNAGSEGRFTVAWQRPDARVWEVIPRASFGIYARGRPGALEELKKTLVADFTADYAAECFFENGYSHRYKFAARENRALAKAEFEWDFGDGQRADGADRDHVYLMPGTYTVTLKARIGANADQISNRIVVSRDWPHIDQVAADEPSLQAKIVGNYAIERMPDDWLAREVWLQERAGQTRWMLEAADRLAGLSHHPNAVEALAALKGASAVAISKNEAAVLKMWALVPATSNLQPGASEAFARVLLWQTGDFARAAAALKPFSGTDNASLRRLYADALVLDQQPDAARKIIAGMPPTNTEAVLGLARSGAMARTVEYYIAEKDGETGQQKWEEWMDQYPADFFEGYSVVLESKLMEIRGAPLAAAKLAEAFASAVPGSSYAPQLLYRASKLLESSDTAKSQELMKALKARYPEDPLSN